MSTTVKSSTTAAFVVQAAISFGVSLAAWVIGIAYLPVGGWIRAFLGLALLYAVTSTFTLAKCVRDRQDTATIAGRVDQARLDKLLAEHDPFKVDTWPGQRAQVAGHSLPDSWSGGAGYAGLVISMFLTGEPAGVRTNALFCHRVRGLVGALINEFDTTEVLAARASLGPTQTVVSSYGWWLDEATAENFGQASVG